MINEKKLKLDEYEKEILDAYENDLLEDIDNEEEMEELLYQAALNTKKKSDKITLRVNKAIITSIKVKALKLGMPYQTLINTMLHKLANTDDYLKL